MSIVGAFPSTLQNGTAEDATQVMALFAYIQSQVNGNACPATSTSAILKGNGSGGTQPAVSGTDYCPAAPGSTVLKGNGAGATATAVAGTDYQAAVTTVLGSTGHIKIPSANGPLLIQWGAFTTLAGGDVVATFDTLFPSDAAAIILTPVNGGGTSANVLASVGTIGTNGFNAGAYNASTGTRVITAVYYMAIGSG